MPDRNVEVFTLNDGTEAKTSAGTSQRETVENYTEAQLLIYVTAITDTLDLELQVAKDASDDLVKHPDSSITQISATGNVAYTFTNLGKVVALNWTPSTTATFKAYLICKN